MNESETTELVAKPVHLGHTCSREHRLDPGRGQPAVVWPTGCGFWLLEQADHGAALSFET